MSKSWCDSLDEEMDFSQAVSWLDAGNRGDERATCTAATTPRVDGTTHTQGQQDDTLEVGKTPSEPPSMEALECSESLKCSSSCTPDCTGLWARLGDPIVSSRGIRGFTCAYVTHNGSPVNTGDYTVRISLPNDAPIDATVTLRPTFAPSASPFGVYAKKASQRADVRVSCKSFQHDTRVIEMDWSAWYQVRIQPPAHAGGLQRSISITDLDMRGCVSLYGYLHSLWSTTLVRFLTNAYNQYKTLRWSASIGRTATRAVDRLAVQSHIGKTNFTVNVVQQDEPVCKMSGHWIRSGLLETASARPSTPSSTQVAPTFRMRGIADAIRHVSILHGLLFGGMSHQVELAATVGTVVVLSSISYEVYTARSNVELHPHVALLDVVDDREFHVRMVYYDADGALFMSSTGRWVSIDKETSDGKPLPKTTVDALRQFFEQ